MPTVSSTDATPPTIHGLAALESTVYGQQLQSVGAYDSQLRIAANHLQFLLGHMGLTRESCTYAPSASMQAKAIHGI